MSSGSPGLFGGTGDNGVCAADALVAFLASEPDKAKAWVAAFNADPTFTWSGGDELDVSDIPAYVDELTATFLEVDTRVTNHGFRDGVATPRESLLEAGTAVLVDADGEPRVRCFCGNPLHLQDGEPVPTTSVVAPTTTSTPTIAPTVSPTPLPTVTVTGPDCATDAAPMPAGATNVTTAPIDVEGDGTPEVLLVYDIGGVWHVRVERGGVGIDDEVLVGFGPVMTAVGGATVNNDLSQEAFVKIGSGAATSVLAIFVFLDCELERLHLNNVAAEFPVGISFTHADGLHCFGFDVGIEVYTTSSSDAVTYTGTVTLYLIDLASVPPSLVASSTNNVSESTGSPSFLPIHTFGCDTLGPGIP